MAAICSLPDHANYGIPQHHKLTSVKSICTTWADLGTISLQVVCSIAPHTGAVELSSATAAGQHRSHFFATVSTIQLANPAAIPAAPATSPLLALLAKQSPPMPGALASATIVVPQTDLGLTLHPGVSEASQHISVAHSPNPVVAPTLRVAAKVDAIYVPAAVTNAAVWAFSLADLATKSSKKWMVGSTEASVSCAFEGVESRRLVTHRPAVMTPRSAVLAHL
jgi:hypothetical protein